MKKLIDIPTELSAEIAKLTVLDKKRGSSTWIKETLQKEVDNRLGKNKPVIKTSATIDNSKIECSASAIKKYEYSYYTQRLSDDYYDLIMAAKNEKEGRLILKNILETTMQKQRQSCIVAWLICPDDIDSQINAVNNAKVV